MSRDALIVGISSYQYLQTLNAPATDAEAIAQCLEKNGEFQVRRIPERIDESNGSRATVSSRQSVSQVQLKQALKHLFLPDSPQLPETALFYFSGHGIRDEEGYDKGYLATSDTNPNNPSSGVSLRWLQWLLSESKVKQQIIWLDCCHSGSLIVNVGAANPGNSESRDRCFIASSRDFESSWEDLNSPYSVFTRALLGGLEPARLPGRWIDTFALVDYINQTLKSELQTPICTNFGEAINLTNTWQFQENLIEDNQENSSICPYKGLEFFDCNEEDPKYFFGRERLTGQLLHHVHQFNFMALVGASGNGKSSVLRAGLLHQLQLGQRIAGSEKWDIRITRPDHQPLQSLALAFVNQNLSDLDRAIELSKASELIKKGADGLEILIQTSTAPRVILVIDQFEEVFTRCKNIEEREKFFACLMGSLSGNNNKLCLIIAMRADFVGKCLEHKYHGLAEKVQQHMISVLPMELEELEAAVCQPAKQVGLKVESSLLSILLDDIAGAPGSLPLLQYTLKSLWHQRQNNTLLLSAYQSLGGINGTLDKRATNIYNSFDDADKQTVQHIFQQLTQLGEGTEDTRRRVLQNDLVAEPRHSAERVQQIINRLSNPENRLLVTSEVVKKSERSASMVVVDVAHEALIRNWSKLRQWLNENRDLIRQYRKVEESADEWIHRKRNSDYLLMGHRLNEAENLFLHQLRLMNFLQNANQIVLSYYLYRGNSLEDACSSKKINVSKIARDFIKLNYQIDIERAFNACTDSSISSSPLVEDYIKASITRRNNSRLKQLGLGLIFPLIITIYTGLQIANKIRVQTNWEVLEKSTSNSKAAKQSAMWALRNLDRVDNSVEAGEPNRRAISSLQALNQQGISLKNQSFSSFNLSRIDLSSSELSGAYLHNINLSQAKLEFSTLYQADLSNAHLIGTNLNKVILREANLNNANLSGASLRETDLTKAELSNTILFNTDLRRTRGLSLAQIEGDKAPIICNSPLPKDILPSEDIYIRRDCDKLPHILYERYEEGFESLEEAKQFVKDQLEKD